MTKEEYFLQKSKFYYDMFLQNKYVRKVSTIIKVQDKFAMLTQNNKIFLPGGSVELTESTKQAAIRETLEETGITVSDIKYLTKLYYSVDWNYNNIKFKNKRIEFYYLAKCDNITGKAQGIEGEFDSDVKLQLFSISELEDLGFNKKELEIIKNIKF